MKTRTDSSPIRPREELSTYDIAYPGIDKPACAAGAKWVVTDIKIDDRRDELREMEEKVEKVKKHLREASG